MVTHIEAGPGEVVRPLNLKDSQGGEWAFTAQGPINVAPRHLRRHLVSSQPVTVVYTQKDDRLVLLHAAD